MTEWQSVREKKEIQKRKKKNAIFISCDFGESIEMEFGTVHR